MDPTYLDKSLVKNFLRDRYERQIDTDHLMLKYQITPETMDKIARAHMDKYLSPPGGIMVGGEEENAEVTGGNDKKPTNAPAPINARRVSRGAIEIWPSNADVSPVIHYRESGAAPWQKKSMYKSADQWIAGDLPDAAEYFAEIRPGLYLTDGTTTDSILQAKSYAFDY